MKLFGHKKIIYRPTFLILLFTCWAIGNGCILSAGSYAYAETYKIPAPEQKVIKAVNDFKIRHPETVVPISDLEDGRKDSSDYWYHIYFYLPKENRIVYCWTRPENKSETTFAIVGINEGLTLGNWKLVNKDFTSTENKKVIDDFERTLLNPIKKIVQDEKGL